MNCKKCGQEVLLTSFRKESLSRFWQFTAFAAVLLIVGFVFHFLSSDLWHWAFYFLALFVQFQALLKWRGSRFVRCENSPCQAAYTHYGRLS